ncbi:MAG: DUF4249 domain-containing protein [Bacteroidia bacterium]|nr:DUF4249 domain-containing protein [Bacteroidia bacterium]
MVLTMGIVLFSSCLEEIDLETFSEENFVPNLVVEATLTDELKIQTIYLSRSDIRTDLETDTIYNPYLPLGLGPRDSVNVERFANVSVKINGTTDMNFRETAAGIYTSDSPFAVETGSAYEVIIQTNDGSSYRSVPLALEGKAEITDVYAERTTNEFGIEGVMIYVDGSASNGQPENYRYTFEETYKIIAPVWDDEEFQLTNYDPCALPVPTYDLEIIPRTIQNQVCYNTVPSNTIVLNNTAERSESAITRFPVHFISRDDFIISHRYSIEVSQFVEDADAYSYYSALSSFSQSGNIFSQVQPGSLRANVSREGDPDELVLGFVEVASVSKQRIFFNYEDLFPGEELPPYPFNCNLQSSLESHVSYCFQGMSSSTCPQSIIERVNLGLISYVGLNDQGIGSCPGPYVYVFSICGDCTLLGSKEVPEFWID